MFFFVPNLHSVQLPFFIVLCWLAFHSSTLPVNKSLKLQISNKKVCCKKVSLSWVLRNRGTRKKNSSQLNEKKTWHIDGYGSANNSNAITTTTNTIELILIVAVAAAPGSAQAPASQPASNSYCTLLPRPQKEQWQQIEVKLSLYTFPEATANHSKQVQKGDMP